jgi:phage terminase Nu1 subunit (DNA packaging protein)
LRGRYSLVETKHAYIRFLRDGKLDDPDENNYTRARTRRMVAEAKAAELRLAVLSGKLYRAEDIEFIFTNIFTAVKAKLFSIPSRVTRLLIGKTDFQEIFNLIMREIEAACSELVEINASLFNAQNEQYLEALFPESADTLKANGSDGVEPARSS